MKRLKFFYFSLCHNTVKVSKEFFVAEFQFSDFSHNFSPRDFFLGSDLKYFTKDFPLRFL